MTAAEAGFLQSALDSAAGDAAVAGTLAWMAWLAQRQRHAVHRIPFSALEQWHFDSGSGNLAHLSGHFFRIEGIRVEETGGHDSGWDQPIIHQPEVGILGLITRVSNGVRRFLVQAKMEPGNINTLQVSPTVQATRSNFTRVHAGKETAYLDYFCGHPDACVLVDELQSEQGARFYRKRNRNMIVEITADIPVLDEFRWLTLAEIHALMHQDNAVNIDTRSIISCIDYPAHGDMPLLAAGGSLLDDDALIDWLTELKKQHTPNSHLIPLRDIRNWQTLPDCIRHRQLPLFSVIAVAVEAPSREVPHWTQPMLMDPNPGLIGFIVSRFQGVPHFLVQAKAEPGSIDAFEISPTVSCSHANLVKAPFAQALLQEPPAQRLFSAMLSEEGGRFYQTQNRNLVVEIPGAMQWELPANFRWASYQQLQQMRHFGYLHIDTRTLLACLPPAIFQW